ncbi:HAD family hydrolase [Micromonospora sp. NPDC047793]|uniref:HAD family hydrolase n=1 Tax=Micromonospora sp. NPDC047793 TaxID=3154342 RepID=UPI0033C69069
MLSTVVFDADETLLDLRPAVTGGLVTVLDEMRRLTPAAAEVSLADLESDWDAVFGDLASAPVTEIRRAALARSLARADLGGHLDELAGVPPSQVVHVGDNPAFDVVGAQRAGLRAIWLNRRGDSLPAGVLPDATVSSLAELPAVLVGLSGEADLPPRKRRRSGETSCVDV